MGDMYLKFDDVLNYLGSHIKYKGKYIISIPCAMIPIVCKGITIPPDEIGFATDANPNRPIDDIKSYLNDKGIKLIINTDKYSIHAKSIRSLEDWVNTLPVNRMISVELYVNGTMEIISKYIRDQLSKIPKTQVGKEIARDRYRPRNDILQYLENVNVFLKQL